MATLNIWDVTEPTDMKFDIVRSRAKFTTSMRINNIPQSSLYFL